MNLLWITLVLQSFLCIGTFADNSTSNQRKSRLDASSWTSPSSEGMWFNLLEDYIVGKSTRSGKFVPPPSQFMPPPLPSPQNNFMITKRMGEAIELEPHMRPPGKVISPLLNNQNFPVRQSFAPNQPLREVSETDLYLLGAIEKLVYRVDYLESRVRRSEQFIYYLMSGNKEKPVSEPCPKNFSRIGDNCYHIEGERQVNWKTANGLCKSIGAHLAEFENLSENEDIVAHLLNHPSHRGKDFWLGGLNPGLLWIWSNSAKPVNPNTNLTFVANNPSSGSVTSKAGDIKTNLTQVTGSSKIVNNSSDIKGSGRCLRLSYNPAKHSYFYFGQECTSRHHFVCEYTDKTLDNSIKRISKELNINWV